MNTVIKTVLVIGALAASTTALKAADAAELWSKNCVSCHAADGSGSTTMGKKYGAKDYRDAKVQADLTDEKATKAITEGISEDGKVKMKPFKDKLTPEEITALIAHIRTFKK